MIASPLVTEPSRELPTLAPTPSTRDVLAPRLRLAFRLLAIALCGLHAYTNRHLINPDGIAYLDMATGDGSPNGSYSRTSGFTAWPF